MTAIRTSLRWRRESASPVDAAAFEAAYRRHHQALYRYCRSILRHDQDAQDAVQTTMARAFASLRHEERDIELRPWLFQIAHNEAITILRRRRTTSELRDAAGHDGELEDRVAEREDLRLLRSDLEDLPERQRAALVLRELNGLGHAEIGKVLELSPGAAKQAIFEARTALFACQEGRDMACEDVRRMLSDGDGRTLRGRGVRAHLRSCPGCRRFRAQLETRPQALKLLAPPLPMGAAAALLSELLGAGTAAKLLACVAIAGGGTTLALEVGPARVPAPLAREQVAAARPAQAAVTRPAASVQVRLSRRPGAPASVVASRPAAGTLDRAPARGEARGRRPSAAKTKQRVADPPRRKTAERHSAAQRWQPGPPGKPAKAREHAKRHIPPGKPRTDRVKVEKQSKVHKPADPAKTKTVKPDPPGRSQAAERGATPADGAAPATPPGQAKHAGNGK